MINFLKLKSVLKKNFDGQRIYISTSGILSMNYFIEDTKVIINSRRLIIGCDSENDFIIDLYKVEKIRIDKSNLKITFCFDNLEIEIQV